MRKDLRTHYTKAEIIAYLRRRAKLLYRTPTVKDVKQDGDGPSMAAIRRLFGDYNGAIMAAGLAPLAQPWKSKTDEELLEAARKWSAEHNGAKLNVFLLRNSGGKLPSDTLVRNRFGTVQNYFEQARVPYEYGKKIFNKF